MTYKNSVLKFYISARWNRGSNLHFRAVKLLLLSIMLVACESYPNIEEYAHMFEHDAGTNSIAREIEGSSHSQLNVAFLTNANLLFFDRENSILIDGYFSRPSDVFCSQASCMKGISRKIENATDAAEMLKASFAIDTEIGERVIIPVHSHFDHAMDVGPVSDSLSAKVLGSRSTKYIYEGWLTAKGLSAHNIEKEMQENFDDAYIFRKYNYGNFVVTLLPGKHGKPDFAKGIIKKPVTPYSATRKYRSGESYLIHIRHKTGFSALVVGSAGLPDFRLHPDLDVDVVFICIAGVAGLFSSQKESTEFLSYMIDNTKADVVVPIHWDELFGHAKQNPPKMIGKIGALFFRPEKSMYLTCMHTQQKSRDLANSRAFRFLPFFEPVNAQEFLNRATTQPRLPCPQR